MSEKNLKKVEKVFYVLIVLFILIIINNLIMTFVTPMFGGLILRGVLATLFLPLTILFFVLGIVLIFLTLKSKIEGKLKLFLLLTGASPVGFLISVILHGLLEALGIILHVVFFFIAILVCPILFLIGAIGSIVLFKRKGGRHSSHS